MAYVNILGHESVIQEHYRNQQRRQEEAQSEMLLREMEQPEMNHQSQLFDYRSRQQQEEIIVNSGINVSTASGMHPPSFQAADLSTIAAAWDTTTAGLGGGWNRIDDKAYATMQSQVQKGARLLDDRYPRWYKKINRRFFNVSSTLTCMMGQLYGEFFHGLERLGISPAMASKYGFATTNSNAAYLRLNSLWIEEMDARVRAADEFAEIDV